MPFLYHKDDDNRYYYIGGDRCWSDTESILDNNKNISINKLQTVTEDGTFLGLIPATEYNESANEDDNPVVVILK